MALVLLYLVVLVLVAIVLFGAGSLLFGRGEQLPPLPKGTTATVLPAFGVTGADVDLRWLHRGGGPEDAALLRARFGIDRVMARQRTRLGTAASRSSSPW